MKTQPIENLELVIIGQRRGKRTYQISTTNPCKETKEQNIKPERFIKCELFRPTDPITLRFNNKNRIIEHFFETKHCNFFKQLEELIRKKKTRRIKNTIRWIGKTQPILLPGKIIIHKLDFKYNLTHNNQSVLSNSYNPKTKKFEIKPAISNTLKILISKSERRNEKTIIENEINKVKQYKIY